MFSKKDIRNKRVEISAKYIKNLQYNLFLVFLIYKIKKLF